jgi:NADPH:quinone reductase
VPLPPSIDSASAAGIFVQGSTAQLMISQVAKDLKGKTVLINAAAGGVGSLLVQLAKMQGATVIAACSTDDKLKIATALGADFVVDYSKPGWSEIVKKVSNGKGVDFAFEMVGGEVYNETVKSIAQGGLLIVYGCASGIQGTIHPEYFVDENISQSGFNLAYYITNKAELWQEALGAVIGMVAQGLLKISTANEFPLENAAEAHRQIEARQTTGKVILTIKNK